MRLATKMVEHASHFNRDVACTDKSHLLRPLFQIEETIRSYAQFASRSVRDVCYAIFRVSIANQRRSWSWGESLGRTKELLFPNRYCNSIAMPKREEQLRNVRTMAACGQQNLFSTNGLFAAVVEENLGFVLRKEVSTAVKPFNVIISKVLGVNSVQAFDISITLVFEGLPIKRSGLLDGETVCFGFMKGFRNCGSIPGDFLRNTPWRELVS